MSVKQQGINEGRFCVVGDGAGARRAEVLGRMQVGGVNVRVFKEHVETYYCGILRYFNRYEWKSMTTEEMVAKAKTRPALY